MKLGQKIGNFFSGLGQKFNKTASYLGEKANKVLKKISRPIKKVAEILNIDDVAKEIGQSIQNIEKSILYSFPKELQPFIQEVYALSPIGARINQIQSSAEIISGQKDLSLEELTNLFPNLRRIRDGIEIAKNVSQIDKQRAKSQLKKSAMKILIGILKKKYS